MTDETCAQRIADQMASREADLTLLYAQARDDGAHEDADAAQEQLDNFALEATVTVTLKVLLSTGGPADYLTAEIEEGKYEWERSSKVTYHFADWFDHAEMELDDDSSLVTFFDGHVELHPMNGGDR